MGINQDSWHKRRKTGGRRPQPHKKRKYELGRPAANTKLEPKRIHDVRVRGGNIKKRALRLDHGNFSWSSQAISRKARIIDTVYNASNNELVRTKTLVKNTIVQIDAAPLKQWYESHYLKEIGKKKVVKKVEGAEETAEEINIFNQKRSSSCMDKYEARQKLPACELEQALKEQFLSGTLMACISSRPGQVGRADGYILEGKELEFYSKKLKAKKSK